MHYTIAQLNGLLVEYIRELQAMDGEVAGIVILDIAPFLRFIEDKEKCDMCKKINCNCDAQYQEYKDNNL